MLRVGDRVYSPYWNVEGIIQEIIECWHDGCNKKVLTFNGKEYYHIERFTTYN